MSENGKISGQKTFAIPMESGDYLLIQPLSVYAIQALERRAEELYPFPAKADYEMELDPDKALVPGQKIPAEENPDYKNAYDIARSKQRRYVNDKALALSVDVEGGKDYAIAKYAERIAQMRDMMTLPEDEWEATLFFCLIGSQEDLSNIVMAINGQNTLPTEEEIRDGMRLFRCSLRQPRPARRDRQAEPSRPIEDESVTA